MKGMAEKQDIAMNAFKVLTDITYLYGEATDSSQGKIKRDDLFKLLPLKNHGIVEGSLDKIGPGFGYNAGEDGSNVPGMFLCVGYSGCRLLIKSDLSGIALKFKCSNFAGNWSPWRSITFT